jgi:hypothetical protein
MMIGLNHVLQSAGVNLLRTKLVRHSDSRALPGRTPYDLWLANDGRLELYQRIQSKERFKNTDWIITFVVTPLGETLFVGSYRVLGIGRVPDGTTDPVGGHDVSGLFLYDIEPDKALKEYAGRITIKWTGGFINWSQQAGPENDKEIVEIKQSASDPPFPGFGSFIWPINQLSSVPSSWRGALAAIGGVYLLVCHSTGKQYVGSAHGEGGFWARWQDYFRTGHGGNKGMKSVPDSDYHVSILEFASSSMSDAEIIRMEERWEEKLLTRKFGLN